MLRIFTGAHTIGLSQCLSFLDRLYNFLGTGLSDPNLDPTYADFLRNICPNISDFSDPRMYTKVSLDFKSQFRWDLSYFRNVRLKRGLLRIDDEIGTDPATRPQCNQIASSNFLFDREFIQSVYKMSQIGVITNPALGNIRKVCQIVGAPTTTTISMPLQLEEDVLEAHSAF
jgi:peroxidase